MEEGQQKKHDTTEVILPQPTMKAAKATTSAVTSAAAIAPQKRSFKWYTPISVTADFVKGTVLGFGNGVRKGAGIGLKLGLAAAAVAFFLPLFPVAAAAVAQALPWLTIGTNAAGVATFLPNGIPAILAGIGYGLGGAVVGAAFSGGMGLLTGGAYELKLRGRREKYAEELAERAEMRARVKTRAPSLNWRDYGQAVRQQGKDTLTYQFYFDDENRVQRQDMEQQSWADRVTASRHQQHNIWR